MVGVTHTSPRASADVRLESTYGGAAGQPDGPVWVIGVDGATWDLLRPFAAAGELPNVAALMREGSWGTLRSEEPTISPALWSRSL